VTAIQRFGSALNTNVHFHTLVAQGVFVEKADGRLRFVPSPAPTDVDVARLVASVRQRIVRLVARHGIDLEQPSDEVDATDERLFECIISQFPGQCRWEETRGGKPMLLPALVPEA